MKLLLQHLHSCKEAWRSILTKPFEHLINIIVLAVIIFLCLFAITIGNNLNFWQTNNLVYPRIAIYMDKDATPNDIGIIERDLHKFGKTIIRDYKFISKQQALDDLKQDKKLKEIASDAVDEVNNPLPDVFIVEAATTIPDEVNRLNLQLGQLPKVDDTNLDLNYVNKVSNLIDFSFAIIMVIQVVCLIIAALVIYNLIRLQMLLKVDAISVSRLIGASDSFIMRPLLHYAILQISLAMLVATGGVWLLINHVNGLLLSLHYMFGKGIQIIPLSCLQIVLMWLILIAFTIFTVFVAVRWVFRNTYHN